MDDFQLAEKTGREKLETFLKQLKCYDLEPTKDKYDEVDYFATFKSGNRAVYEVKNRNLVNKYTGKMYDEIMLGDNKVSAIKDRIKRNMAVNGYYACFHNNHLFLFDVINCPFRIGYENCLQKTGNIHPPKTVISVHFFIQLFLPTLILLQN